MILPMARPTSSSMSTCSTPEAFDVSVWGVVVAVFDVSVWGVEVAAFGVSSPGVGLLIDVIVFATVESVDGWPEEAQPVDTAKKINSEIYAISFFDFIP